MNETDSADGAGRSRRWADARRIRDAPFGSKPEFRYDRDGGTVVPIEYVLG